ncbi:MAG: acyl-ACP--UDP-N-acetylglucosamine O-acyltransferase [Planctomycetota bacterium]|jgi:UDP-N-acetylglucosamine acyltransferase
MSQIHPNAIIAKDAELADDVVIGPNCVIESKASIGSGTRLEANIVIGKNVRIGNNNQLLHSCVIGTQPQVLGLDPETPIGTVVIGDNNVIREFVTIHPSMYPDITTEVGSENLLMIGVHIGHDCILQDKIVMSNYVQISGHCKIETGAWLSGMVLLHQFVTIGKWCYAAGLTGINKDVPPFMIISGHYPSKIRGVNKRGLVRAGLSDQQQKSVLQTYKKLYRQPGNLVNKAKELTKDNDLDENVMAILDSILKSSEHRYSRHLESFRH